VHDKQLKDSDQRVLGPVAVVLEAGKTKERVKRAGLWLVNWRVTTANGIGTRGPLGGGGSEVPNVQVYMSKNTGKDVWRIELAWADRETRGERE